MRAGVAPKRGRKRKVQEARGSNVWLSAESNEPAGGTPDMGDTEVRGERAVERDFPLELDRARCDAGEVERDDIADPRRQDADIERPGQDVDIERSS